MRDMNTSKIALYTTSDQVLTISPAEAIREMWEHTDGDGTLYIPEWYHDIGYEGKIYRCSMDWTKNDVDRIISEYETLYAAICQLAGKGEPLGAGSDTPDLPADLQNVYDTYLRDFDTDGFDMGLILAIEDKLMAGDEVTEEERALYERYRNAIHAEAASRVGGNLAAYDTVIRAKRLHKLLLLHAPVIVSQNEALLLAEAMVIHAFCKEMETVDSVE